MTVNSANFLQYVPKDSGNSNNGNAAGFQFAQQAWAAGGLFVDANATEEQKVQAASTSITSLLALFGNNEAGAARQATQANENAADELDKSIQTTTDNVNTRVNEQINRIKEIAAKVQENLDKINEENKEKEENQKKLQEYLDTIDCCKAILENPDSVSAERTVAIEKLKTASAGIADLAAVVEKLQKSSSEESEQVEELGTEQSDVDTDIDATIQEGNSQLDAAASQAQSQITKNTATATKGAQEKVTSISAEAAAIEIETASEASSAIPVVGAFTSSSGQVVAQKLHNVSDDQGQASDINIPSAAKTITKISASELTRQSSLTMFADLSSYALGESDETRAFSETFYSFLEPIGAWLEEGEEVDSQAEQLDSAITVVSQQVEEQEENEEKNNNTSKANSSNEDTQNNSDIKFEFETDELQELSA